MIINSQWIPVYDPPLPQTNDAMACGAYNGSIFILGGWWNRQQLTEYNIATNTMIDHGRTNLSVVTYGTGQFYTQMANTLYMIDPDGVTFSIYNMDTKQFISNWFNVKIPVKVSYQACLASTSQYLVITGGWDGNELLDTVQIFNLSTNQWLNNTLSMEQRRTGHSCIAVIDDLYVIGGYNGSNYISWIEKYTITNTETNGSQHIGDLKEAACCLQSILYNNWIWIIGGYNRDHTVNIYKDTVHIINTKNDSVSLLTEPLTYPVSHLAVIIANNILYAFGGNSNGNILNSWMYYDLGHQITTMISTSNPSTSPTTAIPTTSNLSTSASLLGKHGILISIQFEYGLDTDSSNISIATLRDILTYVIDEGIVNNSICLERIDYNINIMNKNQNIIAMNATIIVCTQQDATILAKELIKNLETNFIEEINDQLVISQVDVHLNISVIEEQAVMETTTSPTIYETVQSSKHDESMNIIIYISIGIILLCLVLVVLYWKKHHHNNLNDDIIYQLGEVEMEHNPAIKQKGIEEKMVLTNNGDPFDDDNIIQHNKNENLHSEDQALNENICENAAEHDHGLIMNTRQDSGQNKGETAFL